MIDNQIRNENFNYYLLKFDNKNVGYLGNQQLNKKLILSKLYISESFHGLKIRKAVLEHDDKLAKKIT